MYPTSHKKLSQTFFFSEQFHNFSVLTPRTDPPLCSRVFNKRAECPKNSRAPSTWVNPLWMDWTVWSWIARFSSNLTNSLKTVLHVNSASFWGNQHPGKEGWETGRRALSNERRLSLSNCECLFLAQGQSSMLVKHFLGPTKEMHWSVPKMKFCFPVKTKWWLYCVLQVQNIQSGVTAECPQAFPFHQDIFRS